MMTKEEIAKFLIENCRNEHGTIDISRVDLTGYWVKFNNIKALEIDNSEQEATLIENWGQKAVNNIHNCGQKAGKLIYNDTQYAGDGIDNYDQKSKRYINNNNQKEYMWSRSK